MKNSSKYDFYELVVEHDEDEPFNLFLEDIAPGVIMVKNISSASILYGSLQIGDYIISANNKSFKNREEFFKYAVKIWPNLKFVVARLKHSQSLSSPVTVPQSSSQSSSAASPISQTGSIEDEHLFDIELPLSKLFKRVTSAEELKNTDKFQHIEMVFEQDEEPLNIELENIVDGAVLVTKVSNFSFVHGMIRSGDYILNINGKSFKNKEEFYSYYAHALREFKLTVARPKVLTTNEKRNTLSLPHTTVMFKPSQEIGSPSSADVSSSPSSGSGQTPGSPSSGSGTMSPSSIMQNLVDLLRQQFGKSPMSAPQQPIKSHMQPLTTDKKSAAATEIKLLEETKAIPNFRELISFDGSAINPTKEYKYYRINGSKSKQLLGLE